MKNELNMLDNLIRALVGNAFRSEPVILTELQNQLSLAGFVLALKILMVSWYDKFGRN